jgi:8-amino-7-oxononanoate synthase
MNDILALNAQPGRTVGINGAEYLFFSGYSYLGMQQVPEFVSLIKKGIEIYGWLFPSSRISNTQLNLYKECEALLSSITKTEDTLLVSSGYTAGRAATSLWKEEIINLDPSHPAIQRKKRTQPENKSRVLAVDSVNVLAATITDFSFVKNLGNNATVIIDHSHGVGLIGENGEGICNKLPVNENLSYIICYSLSKAWNINGGAISCKKNTADVLRRLPEYAAATPPSPALIYAFCNGQHLYHIQREKLKENVKYFQSLIKGNEQIIYHPELPVFILPTNIDEKKLLQKNIIISSFAYPDPAAAKHQRIVVSALHTFTDLEYLANCLDEII